MTLTTPLKPSILWIKKSTLQLWNSMQSDFSTRSKQIWFSYHLLASWTLLLFIFWVRAALYFVSTTALKMRLSPFIHFKDLCIKNRFWWFFSETGLKNRNCTSILVFHQQKVFENCIVSDFYHSAIPLITGTDLGIIIRGSIYWLI